MSYLLPCLKVGVTNRTAEVSAMEKQGLGTGGWGLGICLGMSLVVAWGSLSFGQEPIVDSGEGELRITLRVYNFAPVSERELDSASQVAAGILSKAGVKSDWQFCTAVEGQLPEACNAPLRPDEVALRIVRRPKLKKGALGCTECGTAIEDSNGRGIYATLVYECLELLPRAEGLLPSFILGILMAHEIGHLLLPGKDHSPEGIMRPQMRDKDWRLAVVGALVFTADQPGRIRSEVIRRTGSETTVAVRSQR